METRNTRTPADAPGGSSAPGDNDGVLVPYRPLLGIVAGFSYAHSGVAVTSCLGWRNRRAIIQIREAAVGMRAVPCLKVRFRSAMAGVLREKTVEAASHRTDELSRRARRGPGYLRTREPVNRVSPATGGAGSVRGET